MYSYITNPIADRFVNRYSTFFCWIILLFQPCNSADLVIEIPGNLGQDGSSYRLDYNPPHGMPPPNTTILARNIGDVIQFSDGLPGTKYEFSLYYSNATLNDWLTWTASITTAPDPPTNLSVQVRSGKQATISWSPPLKGHYSNFKLRVIPLNESPNGGVKTISVEDNSSQYTLKEFFAGASYQVQAYTVYDGKESVAYTSRNFTTKPNTPGKFIVWFRNETTLLVLWQPPYPAGIYSHYKVSIEPPDAQDSVLYVEKEGEPPGPAQAAFKGLVPGRAYNISVQTMSEDEISTPTTAQYRTVPLRPLNVTVDKASITSSAFKLLWEQPKGESEFDKYQLSISSTRRLQPVVSASVQRNREDGQSGWEFKEHLEAGKTYQISVKTLSGKVSSWPTTGEVTLRPLPVSDLKSFVNDETSSVTVSWSPSNSSTQDSYKISYHEVETFTGDSNTVVTDKTEIPLESLLPGRNYSVMVQAVSNKMESNETIMYVTTRPSSPIIEDLRSIPFGLNISWKSDVNSRQDKFEVLYRRNDTGLMEKVSTTDSRLLINNLFPGAVYEVKVFALSHNLASEPHEYFQAVLPLPPAKMSIERVSSNSVLVHWSGPQDGSSIISEYAIRYRTETDGQWVRLPSVQASSTEAEVTDMTPGEKYTIQVNTVSAAAESSKPQQVNHTVRPNPVSNIAPLVDSNNITLEWPRPEGRVETFVVSWWSIDLGDPGQGAKQSKNLSNVPASLPAGAESDNKPVRVLIGDLMPGIQYFFEIFTVSYGLDSDTTKLTTRTMPLILSEVVVVNNHHERTSVTLTYTPTPTSSSHFDLYRFSLSEHGIPVIEKAANDSDRKVTFKGLVPGKLYNITAWTVSDGVTSQPIQRQDRLYPEPVAGLNATSIGARSLTLLWNVPRGVCDTFELQWLDGDALRQNTTPLPRASVAGLRPHTNYTFTVVVKAGTTPSILRSSLPVSATFTTLEAVPGQVDSFHPLDIQPSEVLFTWSLPSGEHNGVIRKFTISYYPDGSKDIQSKDFKPWETQGSIKGLFPGMTYIFLIQAETRVGYGQEVRWKQKMPILAPPKPRPQVVPTEVRKTSTTIQIRFRKNYFSNQNGNVTMFTIIVAEDDSKNASGLEMPSWRDVQAYSLWPPYQVLEPYYPFYNNSVEDFTIGFEECDPRQLGYCNGPLKAGSVYKVKIRAFTAPDKFTDTSYSFPIQTDADNTPIIIGITVPIVLLALLVVLIVFMKRRRVSGRRKAKDARNNDTMSLPDSVIEISRPVRIADFAEHYRIMSADSDFRFSEEFEELKHVGRDQATSAADLPCNRPKNRFTNILPYDHSRYKLQPVDDEEGSDYINANYVPGYNSPREFIVTQGPLHSTRDDFWRMCWESGSCAIVMLTRCVEKGREKCDHYWPYDTRPIYYGDISVTILNDSHYTDWTIMEFMLCRGDQKRVIKHFHFTTWPDFGVPNPPQTLARFVRAFRERVLPDQRPIIVHCSAGVGRSGTFITLDRILQQLANLAEFVDIFGIVYGMRKERVWMVQTEQQYICIHQCLLAVLEGQELHANQLQQHQMHHNQGFEDDEGIAESGM